MQPNGGGKSFEDGSPPFLFCATDSATGENRCIFKEVYVDNACEFAGVKIRPERYPVTQALY